MEYTKYPNKGTPVKKKYKNYSIDINENDKLSKKSNFLFIFSFRN